MISSSDISILGKIADLAVRCSLRPSEAAASIHRAEKQHDPAGKGYLALVFAEPIQTAGKRDNFAKLSALLGMHDGRIQVNGASELEDIVDRALSLAPRGRDR